jgi:hypothetical protein
MSNGIRLVRCERAALGAEFALVLPLLLLFLFGIIDAGRFMWEYNRAEKATQMGVRYAVVTDPALAGLSTYSFAVSGGVLAGTSVPTSSGAGTEWFDMATCTNTSCTCTGGSGFCGGTGLNSTAFTNVVARMAAMYPPIQASNVQIEYKNAGIGFAGNPDGPDVSPLVTVKLRSLSFHPITCMVFGCAIAMPDFRATLTLEDASDNGFNPPRSN